MNFALLRKICTLAASTAVLAVPVFAGISLIAPSAGPLAELSRDDDPIRNGFRVTSPREPAARALAVNDRSDDTDTVIGTTWTFTSKGTPSPWQGGGTTTTTQLASSGTVVTAGNGTAVADSAFGHAVTLTAVVTGSNPAGPPALNVTFYSGSTVLGSANLVSTSSRSSTATLSVSTLARGAHTITAKYNGDFSDQPSTSNSVVIAIY